MKNRFNIMYIEPINNNAGSYTNIELINNAESSTELELSNNTVPSDHKKKDKGRNKIAKEEKTITRKRNYKAWSGNVCQESRLK